MLAIAPAAATAGVVRHVALHASDSGGDGDGALEPGEPFTLRELVANGPRPSGCEGFVFPGCPPPGGRTHVVGVFAAATSAFELTSQSSPYPDLPENRAPYGNLRPFAGRVARDARCGRLVRSAVLLGSDQANDTVRFRIPLGERGPVVHPSSGNVPKAIPDDNFFGVRSTMTIPTSALMRDVDVRVDSIEHPSARDLVLSLAPPDSSMPPGVDRFLLAQGRGGPGANYTNTVFDQESETAIAQGRPPFTGHFRPESFSASLGTLYGRDQKGTWTLTVEDNRPGFTGTLRGWGLDIRHSVCSVAPRARFTASRAAVGRPARFDATGSVGRIARFDWDLDGDGRYETAAGRRERIRHAYAAPGPVAVALRATDAAGNESVFVRTVEVAP